MKASAGDLVDDPQRFFGRRVSVKADVEQVFRPKLFTLDEDKFFSTGRDVLVLMPDAEAVPIDGTHVTVTGRLRPFVEAEVTRSYPWLTLDPGLWIRFDRRPAIIADSVRTSSGAELIPKPPTSPETPAPEAASMGGDGGPVEDLSSIVTSPNKTRMVGRAVELTDVIVQRLASERSFWVGGATQPQLFVVVDAATLQGATPGAAVVREGETVTISGEIRRLPGTEGNVTITDWGVTSNVDAEMLKTREVYVYASQVEVNK